MKNRIKTAAFMAAMITMATVLLTGCGKTDYEYIQVEAEKEEPVIIIGEISRSDDVIVLESGSDDDAAQGHGEYGENPGPGETDGKKAANSVDGEEDGRAAEGFVTLLFGGDVLLSDHVLNAYQKSGIGGVLDDGYREVISSADFFMVNQEFPFSSRGTAAEDKQYTFRLPPERVSVFGEMGIDAVTLANNHALDFGTDALLDSCDTLDEAGILHTGAGKDLDAARKPVIVERKGIRVGILGTTRVIPEAGWAAGKNHPGMLATYDAAATLEEIRRMRTECDYVVVFVHWGIERDVRPQDYQRTLGQQYIDAGADLVVGSHPHVLQGIEYYQGKPIVYSLGNFVFGSSIPRTALLEVTLDGEEMTEGQMTEGQMSERRLPGESLPAESLPEGGGEGGAKVSLRLIPGTSGAGYTRRLAGEEELRAFYSDMEGISYGVSLDLQGRVIPES